MKRITRYRIAAAGATLTVVAAMAWLWIGLSPARALVLGALGAFGSVLGTFGRGSGQQEGYDRLPPAARILITVLAAGVLAALFLHDLREEGLATAATKAVAWAMVVASNVAVLRCRKRSKSEK